MHTIIVPPEDAAMRLDRFLRKALPSITDGAVQKALRLGKIKLDNRKAAPNTRLTPGSVITVYLPAEPAAPTAPTPLWEQIQSPRLTVAYQDACILIADKPPGVSCQPDAHGAPAALETHIQAYAYQNGLWRSGGGNAFIPALAHRIDRNTGGLVIAALTAPALRVLSEKIKNREIEKEYLCLVRGVPSPSQGTLRDILVKDARQSFVRVSPVPVPQGKTAVTHYKVLETRRGISLVACRLETGRTHQIRVQWASRGHPLVGDGKYGREGRNPPFGLTGQALYAHQIRFAFQGESGCLSHLNGKTVTAKDIAFVRRFREDR